MSDASDHCPKRMRHGPCGGVTDDGQCEVPGLACSFVARDVQPWDVEPVPSARVDIPEFVVDLRPDISRPDELRGVADVLDPERFAVLVGDHVDEAHGQSPPEVARALKTVGLRAIVTLTCRERSVDALTRDIAELRDAGVEAVHCVTGDHPAARLGLHGDYEFPLDSFGLLALARSLGAPVSVAESPAARPRRRRPERLAAKAKAGASVAILNHAGPPDALIDFADACRALAPTLELVAPVPVITGRASAATLQRFPGLVLPAGLVSSILDARDPHAEGVAAAVAIGRTLRESGRFGSLNLSGIGADAGLVERAELMASVGAAIRTDAA